MFIGEQKLHTLNMYSFFTINIVPDDYNVIGASNILETTPII